MAKGGWAERWGAGRRLARRLARFEESEHGFAVAATRSGAPNLPIALVHSPHVNAYFRAWSPDGRFVMFTMSLYRPPSDKEAPHTNYPRPRIWILDLQTSVLHLVPAPPGVTQAAWGADAGVLYYVDPAAGRLVALLLSL